MTDRKAIEFLNKMLKDADELLLAEDYDAEILKEIDVVKQSLSALQEREERSWISVKDRLPEREEDVIMLFETGVITGGFICDSDSWCAYSDGEYYTDCSTNPTHWMPLPEPPKLKTVMPGEEV